MQHSKFGFSLSGFTLTVILSAMAVITVVQGVVTYQQVYDRIQDGFDRKLLAISTVTAAFISGDDHRKIMEQKDETSPSYLQYAEPMRRIKQEKDVTFLYTQIPTGGNNIVYGLDGTVGPEHSAIGATDVAPDSEINGIVAVYQKGTTYLSGLRTWQEWGLLKSAYVPIFAHDGTVAAMVGTDANMSLIKQRTFNALLSVIGFDVLILGLAGYIAARIARRVTEPIDRLKSSALQVAAGRYGLQAVIGSPTELAAVAGSFNRLSSSLESRLREIRQINKTVESQRRERLLFQALQRRDLTASLPAAANVRFLQFPSPSSSCDASGWVRWQDQLLLWAGPVEPTPLDAARCRHDFSLVLQPLLHRHGADWAVLARRLATLFSSSIDGYLLIDLKNDSFLYQQRRAPSPRLAGRAIELESGLRHALPPDSLLTWCSRPELDASSASICAVPGAVPAAPMLLDAVGSRFSTAAHAQAFLWQTGHHGGLVDALRSRLQRDRLLESHFPGMAAGEIDLLLSVAQIEKRQPDDRLLIQGEVSELLYLVLDGNVHVETTNGLVVLFGAQWIGESSILYGGTANATATALTPLDCIVWDHALLAALLREHPALDQSFRALLARAMMAKLANRSR